MRFSFKAKIYKVGINPCVKIPSSITDKMTATKGYIPVKGKIEKHPFTQTLVPVKNAPYRLYVNGPMLKGADVSVGQTVHFTVEQNFSQQKQKDLSMPKAFRKKLDAKNLFTDFKALIPSRQKKVVHYLNYLKTKKTLMRNIDKMIAQLKSKKA